MVQSNGQSAAVQVTITPGKLTRMAISPADVALRAVVKKLERPAYSEGFEQLYYVRLAGDQKFDVQEWADASTNDQTL